MNLKYISSFAWTFLLAITVHAQVVDMTLSEVVDNVLQKNIDLEIASTNYELREADYLQSRAMYYPNLSVEYSGITTSSPLMAFGSKLNQSIINESDFNPALLNDPDAVENFSFRIKAMQPILNFDKKHQRSAAKLAMEATTYEKERTKEYLQLHANQLYLQLQLLYKASTVLEQALTTIKAHREIAQNNVEAGYMHKADLLLIEVRVNELQNEWSNTQNQIRNTSDQLLEMWQEEAQYTIQPSDELIIADHPTNESIQLNRYDLLAMDKAIQSYDELIKSEEKSILPNLNAFAIYETNDNSPLALSGSNYLLGIQVGWTLFDGMQRGAKIQRAKANLQKSVLEKEKHLQQNQNELRRTLRNHRQLTEKLVTVQLAVQQAAEVLRIRSNRFEQGMEKAADVLMAETQYSEKQLLEYQTIMEINMVAAYASFLTSSQH